MSKKPKVKVELNINGLRELMKSQEMQDHLQQAGEEIARSAGEGYGVRTHVADYTAITNVYPETKEAAKDNLENNTLLRAASNTLPMHK